MGTRSASFNLPNVSVSTFEDIEAFAEMLQDSLESMVNKTPLRVMGVGVTILDPDTRRLLPNGERKWYLVLPTDIATPREQKDSFLKEITNAVRDLAPIAMITCSPAWLIVRDGQTTVPGLLDENQGQDQLTRGAWLADYTSRGKPVLRGFSITLESPEGSRTWAAPVDVVLNKDNRAMYTFGEWTKISRDRATTHVLLKPADPATLN